jgi:hypothetical protein
VHYEVSWNMDRCGASYAGVAAGTDSILALLGPAYRLWESTCTRVQVADSSASANCPYLSAPGQLVVGARSEVLYKVAYQPIAAKNRRLTHTTEHLILTFVRLNQLFVVGLRTYRAIDAIKRRYLTQPDALDQS